MPIRTRFAPSPTGRLHLGHALAAKVARDLAHSETGGKFLLRFEDIDTPRVREPFYAGIEEDLEWLGLTWDDAPLRQTMRTNAYQAALEFLKAKRLVYPCFCTRKEIQQEWSAISAAPHGPEGPLYPGTCRSMTATEATWKIDSGIPHAWRLDARAAYAVAGPLTFHDLRFGVIPVNPDLLGDVVLARKDIGTAYHLAVVVDDAFQDISHVTRGEDLLPSTHVHRLLQAVLDLPAPMFFHHRLVVDADGKRLAKRADALSISSLREKGFTSAEVFAMLEATS